MFHGVFEVGRLEKDLVNTFDCGKRMEMDWMQSDRSCVKRTIFITDYSSTLKGNCGAFNAPNASRSSQRLAEDMDQAPKEKRSAKQEVEEGARWERHD